MAYNVNKEGVTQVAHVAYGLLQSPDIIIGFFGKVGENFHLSHQEFFLTSTHSFFFQAEDGIRCADVTGFQTCALPIPPSAPALSNSFASSSSSARAIACSAANSRASIAARSFFSKPKRKNQRSPRLLPMIVLAPPRLPRPATGTRFLYTCPPKSASTKPEAISSTAAHSTSSARQ